MPVPFYDSLASYYEHLGISLRAESDLSKVFTNNADKGWIRESLFAKVLSNHLPAGVNILYGGFLFDRDGQVSKQLDIILCTDAAPQFRVQDKSFAAIDGCIAIIEVKSNLTKPELIKTLEALTAIPTPTPLEEWQKHAIPPDIVFNESDPFKAVFAYDGLKNEEVQKVINEFYLNNPAIPFNKQPSQVHISGKSFTKRNALTNGTKAAMLHHGTSQEEINEIEKEFITFPDEFDAIGFSHFFTRIQELTAIHRNVIWNYNYILEKMLMRPNTKSSSEQ